MSTRLPRYSDIRVGKAIKLSEQRTGEQEFKIAGVWAWEIKNKSTGKVLPAKLFRLKPAADSSTPLPENMPLLLIGKGRGGKKSPLGVTLWTKGAEIDAGVIKIESKHMTNFTGTLTAKPVEGVDYGWTAEIIALHSHAVHGEFLARSKTLKFEPAGKKGNRVTDYKITPLHLKPNPPSRRHTRPRGWIFSSSL